MDMARPLRVAVPGAWYHVIARGIERRVIFRDEAYYQKFEDLLAILPERTIKLAPAESGTHPFERDSGKTGKVPVDRREVDSRRERECSKISVRPEAVHRLV